MLAICFLAHNLLIGWLLIRMVGRTIPGLF